MMNARRHPKSLPHCLSLVKTMANSSTSLGFLLSMILILLPISTAMMGNHNIIDDFFDKACEEVECGKGKCVKNSSYPLNFYCECDSGWKRTTDFDDNDTYANGFLPCVIPDCSMNYNGCQPAPPPVPEKDFPHNISAWDPCYWAYCGEGTCTKNTTHTYVCECNQNYFNLLNISVFPCYSSCTIGSDCSKLGIKVADATSPVGTGQASSILGGKLHWIVMLMMLVMGS